MRLYPPNLSEKSKAIIERTGMSTSQIDRLTNKKIAEYKMKGFTTRELVKSNIMNEAIEEYYFTMMDNRRKLLGVAELI
jgi:antitoxin component of RelBE/YafQ-DinJ toxin-antitoxin module